MYLFPNLTIALVLVNLKFYCRDIRWLDLQHAPHHREGVQKITYAAEHNGYRDAAHCRAESKSFQVHVFGYFYTI